VSGNSVKLVVCGLIAFLNVPNAGVKELLLI